MTNDTPESFVIGKLLTQDEVAQILRRSTSHVKRLRVAGKLAYLPGRPILIREEDLNAYIQSMLCRSPLIDAGGPPREFLLETEAAEILRCTPQRVYQLRHSGKLRYTPGRPVLIDRADLDAYIATETRKVYPSEDEAREAGIELSRERARQQWIKHRLWKRFGDKRK